MLEKRLRAGNVVTFAMLTGVGLKVHLFVCLFFRLQRKKAAILGGELRGGKIRDLRKARQIAAAFAG